MFMYLESNIMQVYDYGQTIRLHAAKNSVKFMRNSYLLDGKHFVAKANHF